MKIALCSYYSPDIIAWASLCCRSHAAYARRHGFRCFQPAAPPAPERPPAWQKPQILLDSLQAPPLDWAVWIDADAIITNHEFPLAAMLDKSKADLIASHDRCGFNNGVMAWRNTPESIRALLNWRRLWNGQTSRMSDQTTLWDVIRANNFLKLEWAEQSLFNACPRTHHAGSWLCHFAGYGGKADMIPRWANRYPLPKEKP